MSQDQDAISLAVPCFGACPSRGSTSEGGAGERAGGGGGGGIPAAGTYWHDSMVAGGGAPGGGLSPTPGSCPTDGGGGGVSISGRDGGGGGIPAAGTFWHDSMVSGGGGPGGALSPTPGSCPIDGGVSGSGGGCGGVGGGGGLLSTGKSGSKSRPVTVAYVVNGEGSQQNNAESMALQSLKDACDAVGSKLETVNFGKLDFGETTVLDSFYNAGESFCLSPDMVLTSVSPC